MRWPRSRCGRRSRAALAIAPACHRSRTQRRAARPRRRSHGDGSRCHGKTSRRAGRVEPPSALSTPPAQTRPGRPLPLKIRRPQQMAAYAGPLMSMRGGRSRLARSAHSAAMICGRSSSASATASSSGRRGIPARPQLHRRRHAPTASISTRRSGSGSQPVPSSSRSASFAISPFLRWSMSCTDGSPLASRTASRIRGLVTRPR